MISKISMNLAYLTFGTIQNIVPSKRDIERVMLIFAHETLKNFNRTGVEADPHTQ